MKYRITECDVCRKDISGNFQIRFKLWHHRVGTHHVKHMCSDCWMKFREYVKETKDEKLKGKGEQDDG